MAIPRARIEGGMVILMADGTKTITLFSPFDGKVVHQPAREVFSPATVTPEAEFRQKAQKILSRSSYDKR